MNAVRTIVIKHWDAGCEQRQWLPGSLNPSLPPSVLLCFSPTVSLSWGKTGLSSQWLPCNGYNVSKVSGTAIQPVVWPECLPSQRWKHVPHSGVGIQGGQLLEGYRQLTTTKPDQARGYQAHTRRAESRARAWLF